MILFLIAALLVNSIHSLRIENNNNNDQLNFQQLPELPQNFKDKLINCSTKFDVEQKRNFEKRIQLWWNNVLGKIQQAARRISDIFSSVIGKTPTTTYTRTTPLPLEIQSDVLCKEGELVTMPTLTNQQPSLFPSIFKNGFNFFTTPKNGRTYPPVIPDDKLSTLLPPLRDVSKAIEDATG